MSQLAAPAITAAAAIACTRATARAQQLRYQVLSNEERLTEVAQHHRPSDHLAPGQVSNVTISDAQRRTSTVPVEGNALRDRLLLVSFWRSNLLRRPNDHILLKQDETIFLRLQGGLTGLTLRIETRCRQVSSTKLLVRALPIFRHIGRKSKIRAV